MKKYYLTLLVMAIFAIGFAASDEDSSSSFSTQSENQVTEQKPVQKPDFLGTYEVRDKAGLTYHFTFNENGTVTIVINPDIATSEHTTLTGKWQDCRKENYGLQVCYDDTDRLPGIYFPNGIHRGAFDNCAYFCGGYYYPDWSTCDGKKTGWRLEYSKIN